MAGARKPSKIGPNRTISEVLWDGPPKSVQIGRNRTILTTFEIRVGKADQMGPSRIALGPLCVWVRTTVQMGPNRIILEPISTNIIFWSHFGPGSKHARWLRSNIIKIEISQTGVNKTVLLWNIRLQTLQPSRMYQDRRCICPPLALCMHRTGPRSLLRPGSSVVRRDAMWQSPDLSLGPLTRGAG